MLLGGATCPSKAARDGNKPRMTATKPRVTATRTRPSAATKMMAPSTATKMMAPSDEVGGAKLVALLVALLVVRIGGTFRRGTFRRRRHS